jgi:3',5'-cyclic AMP phosphodiesterase CpdA
VGVTLDGRSTVGIALALSLMVAACGGDAPSPDGKSRPDGQSRQPGNRDIADVVRFAVIGDSGWGGPEQRALARRMCRFRRDHPFDLVFTTGDNVYPDGAKRHFRRTFFRPYRCLLRRGVRFHASLGNHDYLTRRGRPQLRTRAFGIPYRNYVVRRKGVRFVVADSNRLRMGWLRRALTAEPPDDWTIAVFHHPVYSPGLHGSTPGFRPLLPRLLRRKGVDLVLNGHDHIYSYTKALRGIRYVVTGGGGGPLYPCSPRWFTRMCREMHHFLYVAAHPRRIWVRAVPIDGQPVGLFSTPGRPPA